MFPSFCTNSLYHTCGILFTIQIVLNNVLQAKPLLSKHSIKELVDPCLSNAYDSEQMDRLALTASLCTHQSSVHRPKMSQACLLSKNTKSISIKVTWV
jgi:hypothetical protein